jgi:hypothetical protein
MLQQGKNLTVAQSPKVYWYREEIGVLRNILVVSWASSKVNYIRPAENLVALGDWATVKFFPCWSMSWFAYKTIMIL